MTSGVLNRHRAGLRTGSFWITNLSTAGRRKAEWQMELSNASTVFRQFQGMTRWLLGDTKETVEKLTVAFNPRQVLQLGADLQKRSLLKNGTAEGSFLLTYRPATYDLGLTGWTGLQTENGENFLTEDGQYLLVPVDEPTSLVFRESDLYPRYAVPFPDVEVFSIALPDRHLTPGLDFVAGYGCLIFVEPPYELFPNNKILVRAGDRRRPNLLSYTLQVDNLFTDGRHIVNYLRNKQTFRDFELAAAEVAGAAIMPWDGIMQQRIPRPRGATYVFDTGVLDVRYPHAALEQGTFYEKGTIIGDAVRIYAGTNGWYRQLNWAAGLNMDGLCPFKGLTAPDRNCRAYAVAASTDVHARIELEGPTAVQNLFWEHVRQSELLTGKYLNSVIGLTDLTDVKFVNPLELMFQFLLQDRAAVAVIDEASLGYAAAQQCRDFIRTEKPVGTILIFK